MLRSLAVACLLALLPTSAHAADLAEIKSRENLRRTPTWSRLVVKYFGDAATEARME